MAKAPADLRSLARGYTDMGVRVLGTIAQRSKSDSARVAAIGLLFERGWGKAPQTIEGEASIQVVIRHILEGSSTPRPLGDNTVIPVSKAIEHE